MSDSPSRTQFPGTTEDVPSSPNHIKSKLKGEFYVAGGLLRTLSPEEIFEEDHMGDVLTELKNKNTKELRQQIADAGASHDMLEKIDDMRASTRKAAMIKAIVPLAREQNQVYLHLVQ